MPEQYINDKGEVKDVTTMNSFELVNGLVKYVLMSKPHPSEFIDPQWAVNVKLSKAELLSRLDTRPKEVDGVRPLITIPLSESDLQDLQAGEEFHWNFTDQQGEIIDVIVRPEVDEDNEA